MWSPPTPLSLSSFNSINFYSASHSTLGTTSGSSKIQQGFHLIARQQHRQMYYLIVLDAYCPGRKSLCYHLALRSYNCDWLVHSPAWNTNTQFSNLLSWVQKTQSESCWYMWISGLQSLVQYLRKGSYAKMTYLRPPGWGWQLSQ